MKVLAHQLLFSWELDLAMLNSIVYAQYKIVFLVMPLKEFVSLVVQ